MYDRRNVMRHKLSVPVLFESGSGMTRDLSVDGIFFETAAAPEVGHFIRLALSFSALADSECAICCEAVVLRSQPIELGFGVAARIVSLEITSFPAWFSRNAESRRETEH